MVPEGLPLGGTMDHSENPIKAFFLYLRKMPSILGGSQLCQIPFMDLRLRVVACVLLLSVNARMSSASCKVRVAESIPSL